MSAYTVKKILTTLAKRGREAEMILRLLNSSISMPNIPLKTMGGEVFWTTIAEHDGYRFQKNMFTQHARILDDDDVRIAWGTYKGMKQAMDAIVWNRHRYDNVGK